MQLNVNQLGSPLRIVPPEPVSVEDFWRVSAENPNMRLELEANGDLIVMTPTTRGTAFRNGYITRELGIWSEKDGRGYSFDSNAAFLLADGSILSPDGSWVSSERWTPTSEDEYTTVLCPDFVIELRSKSDRLRAVQQKMKCWIKNGVELGWLIDPERKAVEVYRRNSERVDVLEGVTAAYGEAPVGGFILELARIWG